MGRKRCEATGPAGPPSAALGSATPAQPPAPLFALSPGDAGPGWGSPAAGVPASLLEDPLAPPSQPAGNGLP